MTTTDTDHVPAFAETASITEVTGLLDSQGYVVVRGVLDPVADIAPVIEERNEVLDRLVAPLLADGRLESDHRHLPFPDRVARIVAESGADLSLDLDITIAGSPSGGPTSITMGPALLALLTNERLLDAVEQVVGPEISSSPIQHFRWKLPRRLTEASENALIMRTPLHQDAAVVLPEADETPILTVWIPLCDVDPEMGPLCVVPESHRLGLLPHCPRTSGVTVAEGELPATAPIGLPVRAGDVIFQHRYMVHASFDNTSASAVRMSLDVRYQPTGLPTGRPYLPAFVARSRAHPESALRDATRWSAMWDDARQGIVEHGFPTAQRWDASAAVCA